MEESPCVFCEHAELMYVYGGYMWTCNKHHAVKNEPCKDFYLVEELEKATEKAEE